MSARLLMVGHRSKKKVHIYIMDWNRYFPAGTCSRYLVSLLGGISVFLSFFFLSCG